MDGDLYSQAVYRSFQISFAVTWDVTTDGISCL